MVTQELPKAASLPGPPEQQQRGYQHSSETPWTGEPNEDPWQHAAPRGNGPSTTKTPSNHDNIPIIHQPGPDNSAFDLGDDDDNDNVWDEARRQPSGANEANKPQWAPDVFRPGGNRSETNPFLKRKPVANTPSDLPADTFAKLDINDAGQNTNPWHQTIDGQGGSTGQHTPQPRPVTADGIESDPWAAGDSKPPVSQPSLSSKSPMLISLNPDEDNSSAWKDEARKESDNMMGEPPATAMSSELLDEQNVWDDLGALNKGKGKVPDVSTAGQVAQIDDWSLIDAGPSSNPPKQEVPEDLSDRPPPLPSRSTGLQQKWVPSRAPIDAKAETYQIKNIRWHDPTSEKNPRVSPILIQNENGPCPLVALVNALTMTTPADSPETTLVEILRPREQISLDLLLKAVFDELMSPRRTNSEDALPDVSDLYAFLQSLHTGMNVNPRFVPTKEMINAYKRTSLTHLHPTERGSLIPGTFENTTEMSLYATFSIPLIHGWLPAQTDAVYDAMERQAASYEDVQNLLFCEDDLLNKLSGDHGLSEDEQQLYQDIVAIKMFLDSSATQLTARGIEVIGKAMRAGTFAILFRNDHFSTLYCHPETLQLLSLVTDAGYRTHDEVVWESLVDVNGEHTEYLSGDFRVVGSNIEAGASNSNASTGADNGGGWKTVQSKRGKERQEAHEEPAISQHEQEDRDLALALQLQEEEDQRHQQEQSRRRRESILSEQYIEQQGHRPEPVNRDRGRTSQTSGITTERRSSNTYSSPLSTSGAIQSRQSSAPQQQTAPQQQQVRSLVPPRRPGVVRRAESGGDDAPPSYEQAAQDPAYVPPVGHPNHSQSSLATSTHTTGISGQGISNVQSASSQRPLTDQQFRRQPVGQANTSSGGRDRDCVIM
ncbi:hypothetical protein QQS21_001997 [Conoideocrella luteorostrata]|uniref:MINDY deubiquitinase domain-containing protein n=1 Tax=Conoideocrella luteorostrata TaxID=1105319 RepID=A0AAJ0CW15_9HYPO|nr:hypothetical protein QQS21_001997 [Conoideocrella luteorostrata]